jgi:malate dehydrogenase (oxaloacetate-decarboxylating)(NADP+)
MAMEDEGTSAEDALGKIWLVDTKGLVVKDRPSGGLNPEKARFTKPYQTIDGLVEVVKSLKPSVLIGKYGKRLFFSERQLAVEKHINRFTQ